jgi:hypothetical protein
MPGKLWHRVRNEETGKADLKEVDLSQFKIEKPTIVYLSGFLTNNDQPGYIAGSIKNLEEILKSAPDDSVKPDIYSWSHKGLSNLFNLAAYDSFPNRRSSEAGYILAEHVVLPLVCDEFKRMPDGSCLGHKIPAEEAAKRLRNLTFFGYSAGSIVAQETFNASLKLMKQVGYDEKEARKLMKEVVLIAAGCISRPSKETDRYTTVTMVASNDRINRFKNIAWGLWGTLRRTFMTHYTKDKNHKPLSVTPLSPANVFINAAARPSLYEYKVDINTGERTKKTFDPLYPPWVQRRSYHELVHYVTLDDRNNGFARIALYSMTNAINRAIGAPDPLQLLNPPANDKFGADAQAEYRERIASAIKPMPKKLARQQA